MPPVILHVNALTTRIAETLLRHDFTRAERRSVGSTYFYSPFDFYAEYDQVLKAIPRSRLCRKPLLSLDQSIHSSDKTASVPRV